jgi:hypothetical protein
VEKSKYPAAGLQKFTSLDPPVYPNGSMSIYRVPVEEPGVSGSAP